MRRFATSRWFRATLASVFASVSAAALAAGCGTCCKKEACGSPEPPRGIIITSVPAVVVPGLRLVEAREARFVTPVDVESFRLLQRSQDPAAARRAATDQECEQLRKQAEDLQKQVEELQKALVELKALLKPQTVQPPGN